MICCICPLPPMLGNRGRYRKRAAATPRPQAIRERHESAKARRKTGRTLLRTARLILRPLTWDRPVQAQHRLPAVGGSDVEIENLQGSERLQQGVHLADIGS